MSTINTEILINALTTLSQSDDTEIAKIANTALVESGVITRKSLKILIGIDVSGSSKLLGILNKLNEINYFLTSQLEFDVKYTVIQFNNQLLSVNEYNSLKQLSGDDIVIDGGTDMKVFYEFLECRQNDFDKWFIITDGFFSSRRIDTKHTYNYLETRIVTY